MLQEHVRATEWALYDYAVKDAQSFIQDPCGWKPDPEVAAAYGLQYDGSPYCGNQGSIGALFRFHIPGPQAQYLYAAAYKKTYGTFGQPLVAAMAKDRAAYHLAATAAAAVAGGVAGGIVGNNVSIFLPYLFETGYKVLTQAALNVFKLRYIQFLGGGAFTIVSLMADIGIEAIMAFADEVKFQQDLQGFKDARDRLATSADIVAIFTADKGIDKALALANAYGLGSAPSPLPKYRPGIDRLFIVNLGGGVTAPTALLALKDHADHEWSVSMWGSWFVRTTTFDGRTVDSITTNLEVTDWDGIQWIATRIGADRFRMTQVNPPDGAAVCPTVNGISTRRDRTCTVYYSDNINIKLAVGDNVNINLGVAPRIGSANSYYFPTHTQTSFPINITGQPAPIVQTENMPAWLQVVNGNLVGSPGTLAGKTVVRLKVQTESGSDQKDITVYYGDPLQFMPPTTVDVTATEPVNFTINTAGTPRPKITLTGYLPSVLSMTDNGDGTASLRGLWNGGIAPFCLDYPDVSGELIECGKIAADNEAQRIEEKLAFNFISPPVAHFAGPGELKFIAGVESRYMLTATGASTPIQWQNLFGQPLGPDFQKLPWLRYQEHADGTALLSGIPPLSGASTTTAFNVCPYARGSQFSDCGNVTGNMAVTVDAAPRFVSNPFGIIAVGRGGAINVFVNRLNGNIGFSPVDILTSRFPKGLSLDPAPPQHNGMVTASISGVPEPGQGGRYQFVLNWTDQLSSVNSTFTLDVLEPARITSPATFTFFEGRQAADQITTQGYPVNSADVDCRLARCGDMSIHMDWGPRHFDGLTVTDHTPQGIPTGVGRFGGVIPTGSSGIYDALFFARNGPMGPEFRQAVKFVVLPTADLNGDGKVDCGDLTAIKNAFGTLQPGPGRGFDLTGDMIVDDKDIDAMVRAVPELFVCKI
jgi:hypothetical protein